MTRSTRSFLLVALAVTLLLAFGVSRYASSEPDGLEKVAADHTLDAHERPHTLDDAPLAGYQTRGVGDSGLSTGLSGVVGVAATFTIGAGLVWLVGRRRRKEDDATPAAAVGDPRAADRLPTP